MATALPLQHQLWRGDALARVSLRSEPSGYPALDTILPGGGWPRGALTEVLLEHPGQGELQLLLPALVRITRAGGWVAWIDPPYLPYAPALAQAGVQLSRLVLVRAAAQEALWAAEQALAAGVNALCWPAQLNERAGRRLQLAAERGRAWAVALRPGAATAQASPAALRLHLRAQAEQLWVRVLKRRGPTLSEAIVLPHVMARAAAA
jgi:cell division inhibitor SulA/protein ImuA